MRLCVCVCVCKPCISILYLSLVMSRELWQRPLWHSVCSCTVMRNNIFLNNTVSWLINIMFQGLGGHAGLMFALENVHVPVMYQKYRVTSPNISWELHLDTVFMTLTDSCRGNADDPWLLLHHYCYPLSTPVSLQIFKVSMKSVWILFS